MRAVVFCLALLAGLLPGFTQATNREAALRVSNGSGRRLAQYTLTHKYSNTYQDLNVGGGIENGGCSGFLLHNARYQLGGSGRDWWRLDFFTEDGWRCRSDPDNWRGFADGIEHTFLYLYTLGGAISPGNVDIETIMDIATEGLQDQPKATAMEVLQALGARHTWIPGPGQSWGDMMRSKVIYDFEGGLGIALPPGDLGDYALEIAAMFIQTLVMTGTLNLEVTTGFKQHILREEDSASQRGWVEFNIGQLNLPATRKYGDSVKLGDILRISSPSGVSTTGITCVSEAGANSDASICQQTLPPGYRFAWGKDSPHGDLGHAGSGVTNDWAKLTAACTAAGDKCKAINTNGYMKAELSPETNWESWTTEPCQGILVKTFECTRLPPPGWSFFAGKDSPGTDLGWANGTDDFSRLAARCDATAGCQAITTDGRMKGAVPRANAWTSSPMQGPCQGMLVKQECSPQASVFCNANAECLNKACGRPTVGDEVKVCCNSGKVGMFGGFDYCYGMPDGSTCWSDAQCESQWCRGNNGGTNKGVCGKLGASLTCSVNGDCVNNACGRPTAETDSKVCCTSGKAGMFGGFDYCYGMPDGSTCWSDAQCESQWCRGNNGGTTKGVCGKVGVNQPCSVNGDCINGACGRPTAAIDSKVCCNSGKVGVFGGFDYCLSMPDGSVCWSDAQCAAQYCRGNNGGTNKGVCGRLTVNQPCSINGDCNNRACGRPTAATDSKVCCSSGRVGEFGGFDYCLSMPDGSVCWSDSQCAAQYCRGNNGGTNKGVCGRLNVGQHCSRNADCKNNACARQSAAKNAAKVCCASGVWGTFSGYDYCYQMPRGTTCWTDAMCASRWCKGNCWGTCRGTCS